MLWNATAITKTSDTLTNSLFPEDNNLTKEIESWRGFADSLKCEEDRKIFLKMLIDINP